MRCFSVLRTAIAVAALAAVNAAGAGAQGTQGAQAGQAPCAAIAALTAALASYGRVDLLRVERISVIGKWAFAEFDWGDGGGDALLVNEGRWRLIRQGGGQMTADILVAFGVDPIAAHLLPTTQRPPPRCNQPPSPTPSPRPAPSPTPSAKPTPTPAPTRTPPPKPTPAAPGHGDAPIDRKFGTFPISVLEITNRIACLDKRVDSDVHADVGNWPTFLEDAIRDIAKKFPEDHELARWIYAMEIFYEKSHNAGHAERMRVWLQSGYGASPQARRTVTQIAGDVARAAQCHMPDSSFTAPSVPAPPSAP